MFKIIVHIPDGNSPTIEVPAVPRVGDCVLISDGVVVIEAILYSMDPPGLIAAKGRLTKSWEEFDPIDSAFSPGRGDVVRLDSLDD